MKGCLKVIVVIAAILLLALVPQVLVLYKEYQVRRTGPARILAACREMITNRSAFRNDRDKWSDLLNQDAVQLLPPLPENFPQVIRDLHPRVILIREDNVLMDFNVPLARAAILGFQPGARQYGTYQFCDGLWFWNGNKSKGSEKP